MTVAAASVASVQVADGVARTTSQAPPAPPREFFFFTAVVMMVVGVEGGLLCPLQGTGLDKAKPLPSS